MEYPYISSFFLLIESGGLLNESSQKTFDVIHNIGKKLGLKVRKSDSIFTYIKKSGKTFSDLLHQMGDFLYTDVTDNKARSIIVSNMGDTLKKINKRSLADFFLQLDKLSFGITAIPRHIINSLFGIEIASYEKWLSDYNYVVKELENIKVVLKNIPNMGKEIELVSNLELILKGKI